MYMYLPYISSSSEDMELKDMTEKVKFLLLLVRVRESEGKSSESIQVLEQARDMQARY